MRYILSIVAFALSGILHGQNCGIASNMGDVSAQVKMLGNIAEQDGMQDREKNIWDLQLFDDKIFIGYGATTSNAGPIELHYYDPSDEKYHFEATIEAEAIERFRVFNDTLFIPNSDPTSGNQEKYNFYDGSCTDLISDPHPLAHVRDMYLYNGKFYLIGNSNCPNSKAPACAGLLSQASVYSNFDNTEIESELLKADPASNIRWNWFFGAMEMEGKLIVPNAMYTEAYNPVVAIKDNAFFQIDGDSISWSAYMPDSTRLKHIHFYPVDTTATTVTDTQTVLTSLRIFEHTSLNDDYLFSVRSYSPFTNYYQESYNNSKGLVFKDSLRSEAFLVEFPDSDAVGEDLLKIGSEIYALANKRIGTNSQRVYIYKSSAPSASSTSWEEVLYFEATNLARSFEYHDGKFYFGLGSNFGEGNLNAGELLEVSVCDLSSCPPQGTTCDDLDPCTTSDQHDGYCGCVGTYEDDDNDGICNYYDDCPNHFDVIGNQQFDKIYHSAKCINVDALMDLTPDIHLASDTITFLPGSQIDAGVNLLVEIGDCP